MSSSSSNFAYVPLTLFDNVTQLGSIANTWIVEGLVDVEKIRQTLDRLISKWPLLAGRVESAGTNRWQVRVPLGDLPQGYEAYGLTSTKSTLPLSHYTKIPIPPITEYLPEHLWFPPERKKATGMGLRDYASKDITLTHWHVTHFAGLDEGKDYSCIGVHWTHGVFDGIGFSLVLRAFEAELAGKPWDVPPLPTPGPNKNLLQTLIDREIERANAAGRKIEEERPLSYSSIGVGGLISYLGRQAAQKVYPGANDWNLIVPFTVHDQLTADIRREVEAAGLTDARPTSGDVIFAWLLQSVYIDEGNPTQTVGLNNLASFRGEWNGELALYPHNAYATVSYPILTVGEISSLPLHKLAYKLAQSRVHGSRKDEAVVFYKISEDAGKKAIIGAVKPEDDRTNETATMSNMSMARIAYLDWSAAGGGKTLTHYKIFVDALHVLDVYNNNGRLENGDLMLSCFVTAPKGRKVQEGFTKLLEKYKR
ncbi:hypothetical protein CC2G_002077 [Coprinopsis cinerea AmutBmut pab1-1]|nr:hypothetical protein CC2G_002077 [Coprinopsis cinerea AmutBmut pab1-1]